MMVMMLVLMVVAAAFAVLVMIMVMMLVLMVMAAAVAVLVMVMVVMMMLMTGRDGIYVDQLGGMLNGINNNAARDLIPGGRYDDRTLVLLTKQRDSLGNGILCHIGGSNGKLIDLEREIEMLGNGRFENLTLGRAANLTGLRSIVGSFFPIVCKRLALCLATAGAGLCNRAGSVCPYVLVRGLSGGRARILTAGEKHCYKEQCGY
jgi:hypothetical protein